jgi:hypothetical protein
MHLLDNRWSYIKFECFQFDIYYIERANEMTENKEVKMFRHIVYRHFLTFLTEMR